jgi:hypothetical protein
MPRKGKTGTSMQRHRVRPRRRPGLPRTLSADKYDRIPVGLDDQIRVGDWVGDGRGDGRVLWIEGHRVWIADRWIALEAILWRFVRKPRR